jgi:AAA+ superfamily predicted ATPase
MNKKTISFKQATMPPFENDDVIIQNYLDILKATEALNESANRIFENHQSKIKRNDIKRKRNVFHQRFSKTEDTLIVERATKAGLNPVQVEVLLTMIISNLGIIDDCWPTPCKLLKKIDYPGITQLEFIRNLDSKSPLIKNKLLIYSDPDADFEDRRLVLDPSITEAILEGDDPKAPAWDVTSEKEFYQKLARFSYALSMRQDSVADMKNCAGMSGLEDFFKSDRRLRRISTKMFATIEQHPTWNIHKMLADYNMIISAYDEEMWIFLLLLGKELGHLDSDDFIFTGEGIAQAVADRVDLIKQSLELVYPGSDLWEAELIQPAGGRNTLLTNDPDDIASTEFELTENALTELKLDRKLIKNREGANLIRAAKVSFDQLVFDDATSEKLNLAVTTAENSNVLLNEWDLGKYISYGNSMTMLFSGGPGLGKTAAAEALAHRLKKPILLVDYSQLFNCFLGQTEKNIVRFFNMARTNNAVLFFDEADSVVTNRDSAGHETFYAKFTNLMLTQIESFSGVLILATNRADSLDPALARRMMVKIAFRLPGEEQRLQILQRLIPEKMPLADDVELASIAQYELSGGQLKNVVLNAGRFALARKPLIAVTMDDFQRALNLEVGDDAVIVGKSSANEPGGAKSNTVL